MPNQSMSLTMTSRRTGRARRLGIAALLAGTSLLACSGTTAPAHDGTEITAPTTMTHDTASETSLTTLELDPLIDRALANPEAIPDIAAELRTRFGADALDHLIARHRTEVTPAARHTKSDVDWRGLIDAVAQQRDAHFGGLYWHRDLGEAQRVALAQGKPILSLRLLGELTSEYSCANSRLFRTLLYSDPELAQFMSDRFVLHWSSERPVPRVAIDFGDGRKLERTITGNSAHFVLDAEGRTLDVIPGLYAGSAFQRALDESLALHGRLAETPAGQWASVLAVDHERRFDLAVASLSEELTRVRGFAPDRGTLSAFLSVPPSEGERIAAAQAVPMAIGKSRIEAPILDAAGSALGGGGPRPRMGARLEPDDVERLMIGARLAGNVELHANAWTIIDAERPVDGLVPASEREAAELALRQALQTSLSQDTAKNALELAPRIHVELAKRARMAGDLGLADVDAWLYARLFETPAGDPWLGLVDPTAYTGLIDGGIAVQAAP